MSIFASKAPTPEPIATRLLALSDALANQLTLAELLPSLQDGLVSAIEPEHMAIFLRRQALYEVKNSLGEAWQPAPFLATSDPLCEVLEQRLQQGLREPLKLASLTPLTEGGLLLHTRGVRRVLPLASGTTLLGFVVIGRKQLPRAYTAAELAAFARLGQQAGAALERALRVEALTIAATDQAQQFHIRQFARQVQASYQLDQLPVLSGWDMAGQADNAVAPPSAFYDCFLEGQTLLHWLLVSVTHEVNPLALSNLGIASGLRMAFRAVAGANRSAGGVLGQIGVLLQPLLPRDTQVHVCYGQLHLQSGALEYSVAGNCTMLLYLPNVAEPIVCPTEGPPMEGGLAIYKSYYLTIKPDFILVAYTDTLSLAQQVLFQPALVAALTDALQQADLSIQRRLVRAFPQLLGAAQPALSNDLAVLALQRTDAPV